MTKWWLTTLHWLTRIHVCLLEIGFISRVFFYVYSLHTMTKLKNVELDLFVPQFEENTFKIDMVF